MSLRSLRLARVAIKFIDKENGDEMVGAREEQGEGKTVMYVKVAKTRITFAVIVFQGVQLASRRANALLN